MMGYRCTYVMLRCCQRTFMPLWLTGATLRFQIRTWHFLWTQNLSSRTCSRVLKQHR